MTRSGGITFSAVLVFIGSAFTILTGVLMLFSVGIASYANRSTQVPRFFAYFAIAEVIILVGLGGWGIASGVGLLKTKQWARVSMLVFAAILLFISLPVAVLFAFVRFPAVINPNLPTNFMAMIRTGLVMFYGLLAVLGVFWLYLFNKRSVKAQFAGEPPVGEAASKDFTGATPARSARPLSITIVAWFLLIGSGMIPLLLPVWRVFFPAQLMPLCMLGIFFFGLKAILVLSVLAVAQVAAAVGLLKLKEWGRSLAIWLQVLGIANVVLLVGIPANRIKFQQIMDTMNASMSGRTPQMLPITIPSWAGSVASIPVFLVILWFLATQRRAFTASGHEPDRTLN